MSQHVMVDPLTLGAQYQLGNYKATYQPRMLTRQDIIVFVVLILFISLIIIIIVFILMPSFTNKIIGSIIIALYVLSFGALNWDIYRKRVLRLFVYDDGLIYIGRKSSPTIIYWQRVQSIIHKVKVVGNEYGSSTRDIYTLNCTDGTSLRLDDGTFQGLGQLMASVEIEIARYLFPVALDTYQMGHDVIFGPLVVTQAGVRYRKRVFPWSEIKGVSGEGHIRIQKQGKRLRWLINVNLAKVPNIEVLRMLTQHIIGVFPPES